MTPERKAVLGGGAMRTKRTSVVVWCGECGESHRTCESIAQKIVGMARMTRSNYLAIACPDCEMGPVLCRERKRQHGTGVCVHVLCVACGYEGSAALRGEGER
jgi:ribosomal protein S27E